MIADQKYRCCFCGTAIESRPPDIGGLLCHPCANGPREFQRDQQFLCHGGCFAEQLRPPARLYVADASQQERLQQEDR